MKMGGGLVWANIWELHIMFLDEVTNGRNKVLTVASAHGVI